VEAEWQARDIVFSFECAIQSHEGVNGSARAREQFTVERSGPTQPLNCKNLVSRKGRDQIVRDILVKQDAQ
jgi:hypothetical protein